MTRLIIVEGMPCSGKSTTARFIADTLQQQGKHVCFVDEGTLSHPADYEFHAFVDSEIIPLSTVPPEKLPAYLPFKIYDGLPWHIEAPLMLDKWRQFVREANPDTVYVFNCVLLQNPMCETLMRFGMTEAESAVHIRAISEIIAPMDPIVIYLHNDDIADSVRRAADERPGWLEAVIPYHCDGGYGKSIGASGLDGYIACLAERQRREERILHELPLRAFSLDNPQRNWAGAHTNLTALLTDGAISPEERLQQVKAQFQIL